MNISKTTPIVFSLNIHLLLVYSVSFFREFVNKTMKCFLDTIQDMVDIHDNFIN